MNTTKSLCTQALYSQVRDKTCTQQTMEQGRLQWASPERYQDPSGFNALEQSHAWINLWIRKKNKSSVDMCGLVILDILLCLFRILLCIEHIFFTQRSDDWSGDWKYFSSLFTLILCRYFNRGRKHYCFIWCKIIRNTIAKLSSHILVDDFLHTLLLIYSTECFLLKRSLLLL